MPEIQQPMNFEMVPMAVLEWIHEKGLKPEQITHLSFHNEILPDGVTEGPRKWQKWKLGKHVTVKAVVANKYLYERRFIRTEGVWQHAK